MKADINPAPDARLLAVLLHPHPQFGGDRFHAFVDAVFHALPQRGVTAVRFDFSTADARLATSEATEAIDAGLDAAGQPEVPIVLCGYSFGAGIAARVDDHRVVGWYLLAPQAAMLREATIGADPRPKQIAVPAHDQFSPPADIAAATAAWEATEMTTVESADHFLAGAMRRVVGDACRWIADLS